MKLKRKLLWYNLSDGLGYLIVGLSFFLSSMLVLYLVNIGVIVRHDVTFFIGILLLIIVYPISRRIGLFIEEKTLKRCMKFLDTLVGSGDLTLHIEERVVVEDIRAEALDEKFSCIKVSSRWCHLKDNYLYINLHKTLLENPDAKKIIVKKRYYEIKKVDFTYYAILKCIVDKSYKEDVKII